MPNLNEFVSREQPEQPGIDKIDEPRPCAKCEQDAKFYYWNSATTEMTWTCPAGHPNSYRIN